MIGGMALGLVFGGLWCGLAVLMLTDALENDRPLRGLASLVMILLWLIVAVILFTVALVRT